MGIEIRKVEETVARADGVVESRRVRTRVFVGEAKEPLRAGHAMFIACPSALIWASQELGGGVVAGVVASYAGFAAAAAGLSLSDQIGASLERAREDRSRAGEPEPSGAGKARLALKAFSELAGAHARQAMVAGGLVAGGAPALAAQWASQRWPKARAFFERANPGLNRLAKESVRLRVEMELKRGKRRCERMFFARLGVFEQRGFEAVSQAGGGELAGLWERAGLTGLSRDPLDPGSGSAGERLRRALGRHEKSKGAQADREALAALLRLCEVTQEARELEAVVGEAVRAEGGAGPAVKARARL